MGAVEKAPHAANVVEFSGCRGTTVPASEGVAACFRRESIIELHSEVDLDDPAAAKDYARLLCLMQEAEAVIGRLKQTRGRL